MKSIKNMNELENTFTHSLTFFFFGGGSYSTEYQYNNLYFYCYCIDRATYSSINPF